MKRPLKLLLGGIIFLLVVISAYVYVELKLKPSLQSVTDSFPNLGCWVCCKLLDEAECMLVVNERKDNFLMWGDPLPVPIDPTDPSGEVMDADLLITDLAFTKSGGTVNCSLDKTGLLSAYGLQPGLVLGRGKAGPAVLTCTPFKIEEINGTWAVNRTVYAVYGGAITPLVISAERTLQFETSGESTIRSMGGTCVCTGE